MSDITIRIWVETSYNTAFRCGGWAFVAAEGRAMTGAAGGERTPSPERIALAGLAEALKGHPAGAALEIHSADPYVIRAPRRIAGVGEPPSEDLEFWAQITTGLKDRAARFLPAANQPRTPTAFATAWAELARDKAKNTGAFRAAIPKTNLAKAGA
jgi:hypothetical protein